MRLAAFSPSVAFLPSLAAAWLAQPGDAADGLIILPNRRAARALAAAFLPANRGRALLLPRITAPGGLDEAGLALGQGLALPPAISVPVRQSLLARLILAMGGENGAPRRLSAAWTLAGDLAALLDEAEAAEIDLAQALPGVVAAELAVHWQKTLDFLRIITHRWPEILAGMGLLDVTGRQSALISAQARAWMEAPPQKRIWLVTSGGSPALTRLAAAIARLPQGAVILPGYDAMLSPAAWEALADPHPAADTHPMAGTARLLAALGARREEVRLWDAGPAPEGRQRLLSQAMLPASSLAEWQGQAPFDLAGVHRLTTPDEQAEASAIAMVLRDALERPGATAALVTPDRGLATRVAAACKRFGIVADDSAGEPLAASPPAVFLRLLARAALAEFTPLSLLALLKHPLAAAGLTPEACRAEARQMELALRGPRPAAGFAGIRFRLAETGAAAAGFFERLVPLLRPLDGLAVALPPAAALTALLTAAEALAATAQAPGAARLWAGEAGSALAGVLEEALAALEGQPEMAPADLPAFLDALLAPHVVRYPRAKDGHPRIAIWGVQEAALQAVDTLVLGGLTEGVWPALPEPGPWLSRPMRKAAALPAPEREVGAAAQQFFALACACRTIVLSAPLRRDRAPAVPARWLTRIDALLAAAEQALPQHPAGAWAARLDHSEQREARPKPAPRPPVALRPRVFSASDIGTLMADPYAIYARHVLGLRVLDPLDEESDASLFGNIVHAGLAGFFAAAPDFCAADAADQLTLALQVAMRQHRPRGALANWWAARLARIAEWVVTAERQRRSLEPPVRLAVEKPGRLELPGGFVLNARADRLEKRADGSLAIMDYKTGTPPSAKAVASGEAPQLPLEAMMAEAGGFGAELMGEVRELACWKLSGRHANGEQKPLFEGEPAKLRAVIDRAAHQLPALLQQFAAPDTPFLASPHPGRSNPFDPYAGVSRRGEWGGEGSGDG